MYYLYRFIDKHENVIYVGRAKNLKQRLQAHKHLPDSCYKEVDMIEFATFESESDQSVYEVYYINLLKPIYNKDAKGSDNITVTLPPVKWHEYSDLNDIIIKSEKLEEESICFKNKCYEYMEDRFSFEEKLTKGRTKHIFLHRDIKAIITINLKWFKYISADNSEEIKYFTTLNINDWDLMRMVKEYNSHALAFNCLLGNKEFNQIDILEEFGFKRRTRI